MRAEDLAITLGGRWFGRYGTAPCPVCQADRRRDQNALTISDGAAGLLVHCKRLGCAYRDILAAAGIAPGFYVPPDPVSVGLRAMERHAEIAKRTQQAQRLWREALSIEGTLAETYLRGRGITCDMPATLRFDPKCWHGPTAMSYPAMVAVVQGGEGFAVHRTYLRKDGRGKADIEPAKAMLGCTRGGAVRLRRAPGQLVVAEGIETALSLDCGLLRAPANIWAGLSTSGLRGLLLPAEPGLLTVAADGDAAGREAARVLAMRAHDQGWQVSILDPDDGNDFNDWLRGKAVA